MRKSAYTVRNEEMYVLCTVTFWCQGRADRHERGVSIKGPLHCTLVLSLYIQYEPGVVLNCLIRKVTGQSVSEYLDVNIM